MHTKKITAIALSFCFFVFSLPAVTCLAYSGGDGLSESTAFQIANTADLMELAGDTPNYDKYFILTADIDLSSSGTFSTAVIAPDTPDTTSGFDGVPFTGRFDGAGHTINNLTIDTVGAGNDYLGLFGRIDSTGEIKNLILTKCQHHRRR
jgi:hypothetical protein